MEVLASAVFWVCFTTLTQLSASSTSTKVSLDEGRILVSWSYDEEADKLSFKVNASTVGWVGFGFARFATNKMQDYDLILAGYKEGRGYIFDMYSTGQSPPHVGSSQDYHLVMATEEEGRTILHFERGANTGDAKDIEFTANKEELFVWALNSSFDATGRSTVYLFYERKRSSQFTQLIQTGGANVTQSTESEAIPHPATPNLACSMYSANDLQPRRDSDAHFNPVNQIDLKQERVKGIHFRTRKLLSIRSEDNNSGLDESSSQKISIPVAEDKKRAEQNKEGSSNKEKTSKTTEWVYFCLRLFCMFFGGLTAIYMGYYICWKMKMYKIKCQIVNLPSDALTQCKEQIEQLRDQINALSALTERNALLAELELKEKIGRIMQEIAEVENHTFIHRQEDIRLLNDKISAMKDSKDKRILFQKLQGVAHLGLTEDLKQMLSRGELELEALNLVQSHITDVAELAKYLNQDSGAPGVIESHGLINVKRRLGPDIEVLCALVAKNVDISKEWVRNLLKKAPTFYKLTRLRFKELNDCCQGAERGEINDVYQIILQNINEHDERRPVDLPDDATRHKNHEMKAADKQKLTEAEKLLEEAKKLAGKNQSELSRKIVEMAKTLILPDEWLRQQEVGEQFLERLSLMIGDCNRALETTEQYESEVDVITKASGGRALCGIYHSEYGTPQPAECQLIKVPTTVNLTSPVKRDDIKCIAFCKEGLATNYVEKLTNLSCRTNLCATGFNGMISVTADAGLQTDKEVDNCVETFNTTASTLYFFQHNKKSFRFGHGDLRLSSECTQDALRIVQNAKVISSDLQEYARVFLRRYGSHFPLGIQTLGGIFFTIADVEAQSKTDEKTLQEVAKGHLETKMSIHFLNEKFGIGGNATRSETERVQHKGKNITARFSYRKMSMGPPANPATFHKLLSYNSNWALIDRGNLQTANKPVWELVEDLGGVFEDVAIVLRETWAEDERKRKSYWDERRKRKQEEDDMERAKDELEHLKETHLCEEHHDNTDGVFPTDIDKPFYKKKRMKRTKAYEKAIKLILDNPRKKFCQIKRSWSGYTLKCWTSSSLKDPKFEIGNGEYALFFSKTFFIWERNIPGHEEEEEGMRGGFVDTN